MECEKCGFWDSELSGCTCPHSDMWYACPIESELPENKKALEEYAEWAGKEEETMINKATRPDEKAPAPAMPRANTNEETVAQLRDMIRELGEERDAMERELRHWYELAKSYERTILRLVTALTREEEE